MLQTNLIFGIQKKIKEGKHSTGRMDVLEESEFIETEAKTKVKNEILLENYYNPSIASGIYEQVKGNQKQTTHKKALMTEAFHISKAEKKLIKDISYFNYLYENFVDVGFQEDYQMLLENIFEDTIRLYQECDVTPRVISPALDSNELNENQIVDLYKNSLNKTIKDKYTKPLLSGKISELYESEIRVLTKKLLEEGVSADIDQVRIYLPFEETLYRFNREVIIPPAAQNRITSFMESTTSEYTDLLEESAEDIMKSIEQKIKLLTSMISPNMFEKAVDTEGVNAPKMAGISIAVDKNFNDDGDDEECGDDICPTEAAAMDPEAAEEMDAEMEAEDLDTEGEDIVGAEEDAKDDLGQASSSEDLEKPQAEIAAELSASENSEEDDQPGAIEADLPSESGAIDSGGHADNNSDVDLQGQGNDSGETITRDDSTLPGGASASSPTNVSDEALSTEIDTGTSTGAVSLPGGTDSDADNHTNTDDVGLQGGGNDGGETTTTAASLPGTADSDTTSTVTSDHDQSLSSGATAAQSGELSGVEVVGADGDDSNTVLGVSAEAPEDEVNTETPSEDEMDGSDGEPIEDAGMPIPRL